MTRAAWLWLGRPSGLETFVKRAAVAAAGCLYAFLVAKSILHGSKMGMAEGGILALAPLFIYLGIKRPLLFPFTIYVLALPFDNIGSIPMVGSLTKLLGACTAVAVAFWLLRKKGGIAPPPILWTYVALLLWMVASLTWAINMETATIALQRNVPTVLLFALLSITPVTRSDLRIIIAATILSGAASAGYGAYLFGTGHNPIGDSRLEVYVGGSGIDANAYAAALLLPLGLALWWLFNGRSLAWRALMVACIVTMGAGLLLSASRGATFGALAMFAYLILRSRHRKLIIGGLCAAALYAVMTGSPLISRFHNTEELSNATGRTGIWAVGYAYFKHHWLLGAGVGDFEDAYDESIVHGSGVFAGLHRVAHNDLVTTGVELGVVGLALLLYATFRQFRMLPMIRADSPLFELRITLEAACLGLFVNSFSLGLIWSKFFWLALMLLAAVRAHVLAAQQPQHQQAVRSPSDALAGGGGGWGGRGARRPAAPAAQPQVTLNVRRTVVSSHPR